MIIKIIEKKESNICFEGDISNNLSLLVGYNGEYTKDTKKYLKMAFLFYSTYKENHNISFIEFLEDDDSLELEKDMIKDFNNKYILKY